MLLEFEWECKTFFLKAPNISEEGQKDWEEWQKIKVEQTTQ